MNRYLKDRADRRRTRMDRGDRRSFDGRRGRSRDRADMGYDMARGRDRRDYARGYDRGMDMDYDYAKYDSRYDSRYDADYRGQDSHYGRQRYGEFDRPMEYEMYGVGTISSTDYRSDYARGRDRADMRDYGDYDMADNDYADEEMEKEYKEDLKKLTEKLKSKDRFGLSQEDVIKRAKQKGINFSKYSEEEFIAVYYMMISDYKTIANDPMAYIHLAKEWLEDDDIAVSPSEKLCIYLYKIIKGE